MSTDIAPVFKFSKTLAAATADVIEAWLRGRNALTSAAISPTLDSSPCGRKRHQIMLLLIRCCV